MSYKSSGFTIIEVLISIFILAVASTVFLLIFQAKQAGINISHYEKSSVIAQAEMERLRSLPFSSLATSSTPVTFNDVQLSELPHSWANETISDYASSTILKSIHIQVGWLELNQTSTYALDTLIAK